MSPEIEFPFVEFILSIGTWDVGESAYLDTGFLGGILIPEDISAEILASPAYIFLRMADNRLVDAPSWLGTLEIDDHRFSIEVAVIGTRSLLGIEFLDQIDVCFEFGRKTTLRFRN